MKQDINLTNLIEIVIPTHNRTDLLKRILDYYSLTGQEFNFIIADSSSQKNKLNNKKLVGSYSKLKIRYISSFPESLHQHLKFSKMVRFLKSKYCVFCPDDDFIIPSGIKHSLAFLEKNPDYSAAHGTYIGFHLFKGPLGSKSFWWNFRYKNQSLLGDTSIKRLTSYLKNLNLVMWSVRRTDMIKSAYAQLSKAKFDPYLLLMYGELLPDSLTVMSGKVKRLNTIYAARQYFASIASNYFTLNDALNKKIYQTEYTKFRSILVKNLVKTNELPEQDASRVIDTAMEQYLKYSYQEYLVNKIKRSLKYFPILQKAFRLLHATYLLSKDKESQLGPIDIPSSKYYKDFEIIRQSVLESEI